MAGWFGSGRAVDLILLVMLAELWWLVARRRWRLGDALLRLLPGALLLLGLRAALTGLAWPWIALPLALSFPAHLADLARRPGGDAGPRATVRSSSSERRSRRRASGGR